MPQTKLAAEFGRTADGIRTLGLPPVGWVTPKPPMLMRLGLRQAPTAPPATVVDALYPDLSVWDLPTFDPHCFKAHGIQRALVQADSAGPSQIAGLQDVGVQVDGVYVFAYYGAWTQPEQATERAIELALDRGVPMVTFDSELDSVSNPPPSVKWRVDQAVRCCRMILDAGLQCIVYSAEWFHRPYLGNTTALVEMGIGHHVANYGANDGTKQPVRMNSAGYAWPYNVRHQYWSLANYCGREARDMNYIFSDGLVTNPEDEPMTPAERAEFDLVKRQLLETRQLVAMNGYERNPDGSIKYSGETAWSRAVDDGSSLFLNAGDTETRVRKLEDGQASGLPNHHHVPGDVDRG